VYCLVPPIRGAKKYCHMGLALAALLVVSHLLWSHLASHLGSHSSSYTSLGTHPPPGQQELSRQQQGCQQQHAPRSARNRGPARPLAPRHLQWPLCPPHLWSWPVC
jgi:hypothetical protein